jgi:hypothetical protein
MGLAPYGSPRFAKQILDHLIDLKSDGSLHSLLQSGNADAQRKCDVHNALTIADGASAVSRRSTSIDVPNTGYWSRCWRCGLLPFSGGSFCGFRFMRFHYEALCSPSAFRVDTSYGECPERLRTPFTSSPSTSTSQLTVTTQAFGITSTLHANIVEAVYILKDWNGMDRTGAPACKFKRDY